MAKLRYAHVLGDTLSETLSLGNSEDHTTLTQAQLDELLKLRENIYTIEEIDRIIGGISTVNFEIVSSLPSVGKNSTIYLVPSGDDKNVYNEYIFIDSKWEPLGSTQIDVDNFIPISGTESLDGHISPLKNETYNLGSSTHKFADVYSKNFHGSLDGNAATATKATQDGDGKTISSTYLKLGGGTMTGNLTLDSSANAYLNGSVYLGNTSMPYILSTTKGKVGMRAYTGEGGTGKPAGQFAVSYDENYDGYFANIQARCDDATGELHTLRVSHLGPTYHINKDDGYNEIHNLSFDDTVVHLFGNETINGNKIFTNKPAVKAASNELPEEYQEVEYIESTGTQFIKTGVVASSNDFRVKIRFMYPRSHGGLSLFGSSTGAPFSMTVYGGRPTFYVGGSGGLDCGYQTEIGRVHVLDAHAKPEGILNINWDGNAHSIAYSGDLNKSSEFFVFGANAGGNLAESDQGYMLYYMEVYDNGVMVRKFIPCYRKSDGAIGLYDKVNDTFYSNAGSGVFAKGSDVDYSLVEVATMDDIPTDYVDLTSDQTISGNKTFTGQVYLNASTPYLISQTSKVGLRATDSSNNVQGQFAISSGTGYSGNFATMQAYDSDRNTHAIRISSNGPVYRYNSIDHDIPYLNDDSEMVLEAGNAKAIIGLDDTGQGGFPFIRMGTSDSFTEYNINYIYRDDYMYNFPEKSGTFALKEESFPVVEFTYNNEEYTVSNAYAYLESLGINGTPCFAKISGPTSFSGYLQIQYMGQYIITLIDFTHRSVYSERIDGTTGFRSVLNQLRSLVEYESDGYIAMTEDQGLKLSNADGEVYGGFVNVSGYPCIVSDDSSLAVKPSLQSSEATWFYFRESDGSEYDIATREWVDNNKSSVQIITWEDDD